MTMKNRAVTLALVTLSCAAGLSRGGTFLTATIDGNFAEWEAVPVLDADPADNANSVDIADIRIANDSDFLYISYIHHAATPTVPTFVSLDVDSNAATGFDVFGLGLAGVEAQWQNDFPFTSTAASFNNGQGMSGDFFGTGGANISPSGNAVQHELAISLDITFNETGNPVFDDADFDVLVWTDAGVGDVSSPISYTLAVPEPGSASLFLAALFAGVFSRRRR